MDVQEVVNHKMAAKNKVEMSSADLLEALTPF
jgi:hypothetical protein